MTIQARQLQDTSQHHGFCVEAYAGNPRLQVITLSRESVHAFVEQTRDWPVQALEYKPFLRFKVADTLDKVCGRSLRDFLLGTLHNRATGAFMLKSEPVDAEVNRDQLHVKLSTAVAHLIGKSNFDAMYGQYYARFTVRNVDNSDSYLRQAHRRMELHNDGTYVNEDTDFVLMMKMAEKNIQGGDSLLLHMDDWQELEQFYRHPLAQQDIEWEGAKSKNIGYSVHHPVFFRHDPQGNPQMLYIDQFAQPKDLPQGLYLQALGDSLENEQNTFGVRVPVGAMLVVHNHVWLHGRDKFQPHPQLQRELLRQRGHFTA